MSKIKNRKLTTSLLPMLAIPFIALSVHADYCPPAPTSVVASVVASVKWDPQTKLYTYSYRVSNSNSSPIPLDRFLVLTAPQPTNALSPQNWHSSFSPGIGKTDWITSAPDPKTKNLNVKGAGGGHLLPAFYAIKPGASLGGFSFQSQNPPGPTKFMIEGNTDVPASLPTSTDDEPAPTCPGWDFKGAKYETMVTGITQGPASPNVTPVAIRLRDGDDDRPYGDFNPERPRGNVGVIVLSTKTFDASTVDLTSIQFGPGKASPLSSRLVPSSDKRCHEEREDWERDDDDKARDQRKDLFLVFDIKAVGVRCLLDHALFLSGKTKDGKAIFGAKAIELVGCPSLKPNHAHDDDHDDGKKKDR